MGAPDFGAFTPAERRAALVHLTGEILCNATPRNYPPDKEGNQKPVPKGREGFASACWAKRTLDAIEFVIRPEDGDQAPRAQGGDRDTPF